MDKRKSTRQFLLTEKKINTLEGWNCHELGDYNLYTHPDIGVELGDDQGVQIALIGFIINPDNINESNKDIINNLLQHFSLDSLFQKLYTYTGRFVLIIKNKNEYFIFHDPCALRSVYYTKYEGKLFAASQPLLFKKAFPLTEGKRYFDFFNSNYIQADIEYYIPSRCSLYEEVFQLAPNCYLDFLSYKAIRYWPNQEIKKYDAKEAAEKIGAILRNIMLAYDKRFKLALPLTAGFDSRVLLSACKPIADKIFYYTLQYRSLKTDSYDIGVPKRLLTKLGYEHHIISTGKNVDPAFAEVYENSTSLSHLNDWGYIAFGMQNQIPDNRVIIKGSCAEIMRCAYYTSGLHPIITTPNQILEIEPGWEKIDFIADEIKSWLADTKQIENKFGYNVMDLYYWEQRIGSWQAQGQLEWDIIQETVTPFNQRQLLDIGLGVDNAYKCKPSFSLFPMIMKHLWEETLSVPINPRPFYHKLTVLMGIIKKRVILAIGK